MRTLSIVIAALPLIVALAAQDRRENPVAEATDRSLRLLQNSAATWSQQRQCFSCHHQGLGLMAVALGGDRGFDVDRGRIREQARFTFQSFLRRKSDAVRGVGITGGPITAAYALVALDAAGFESNDMIDAVQFLFRTQSWDGSGGLAILTGLPSKPAISRRRWRLGAGIGDGQ